MTITLQDIKAAQDKLAEMIASFEASTAAAPTEPELPGITIQLQPGERYAGLILADDGTPSHHVILLPGQAEDIDWPDAKAWATEAGGELPSRREQSLLFANLNSEFKDAYYWSGEEASASRAWYQSFFNGRQYDDYRNFKARCRAVRRLNA